MLLVRVVVLYHRDFGIETWSILRRLATRALPLSHYSYNIALLCIQRYTFKINSLGCYTQNTGKLGVSLTRNMKFPFLLLLNSKIWSLWKLELSLATVKGKKNHRVKWYPHSSYN